ncbi:Clustered mitochondria protein [Glycine soja]
MAGKSGKGRNRKGSHNASSASESAVHSDVPVKDNVEVTLESAKADAAEVAAGGDSIVANPEVKENETATEGSQQKQGDLQLYPVSVKTQTGEKLELQLNPGDSVMDVRQFLLDAPETCFITCYDLLLHTKDGSTHHLEDYNEISEVADITTGGCSLEMVSAFYEDRSIRAHVHRTRELLSLSNLHASLSTSLALQNEIAHNKSANSGDTLKPEVPELDGLGYMEDIAGSLGNLLSSPLKDIKCVESIVFSSFNPPPSYRRLVGDLIYLDVITLEGNKFCITGSTKMFYVNSSSANNLDPKPSKATFEATTLVALLQKISPKFKKAFREVLEGRSAAHPFENVQSLLPPNSWLGLYPVPDHRRDAARAENALTLLYGNEPIGMQRDWNEELQSCREFPHTSPQERILRDRALYKVTSDFVDAAINGAIGVISGCIPPINPTDPECFHMYVHNNIFFSFAIDADLEKLSKKRVDANSKTWSSGNSQSSSDKASTLLHGESQVPNGGKDDGSSSEDLNGTEITQDVSPEAQLAENEQATYASANNDLKGTKAYQEADVPGLYNLAMAIIDYRGHRVVAQSVLPGILQGDKSDSLLYGSVDNGKKICWNEDFHSKVSEAAKRLHLKEHLVLDGSGNLFKLAAPVECKGIVGGDDRHYLLDLLRVTPRDANYTGPGSRFCILRSELISAYCRAQAAEILKSKEKNPQEADNLDSTKEEKTEDVKVLASVTTKASDGCEDIVFNPNVFTEFKLAGSPEEIAADEDNVRKVSQYLTDVVLPKFIQDLCTLEVSPMDGQTLTEALHAHGINVRYIGKVAGGTKHLPHLWDLCNNEIVVRSAKHIIKDLLRETEDHDLAPALSHFLNCLFGSCQAPGGKEHAGQRSPGKHSKGQARWKGRASLRKTQPLYASISSEVLWSDIQEFAMVKYKFELPDDARSHAKKISVIRNLCLKVGVTVAARKYDLSSATPFQTSDVLDIRPVVKHSVPSCSEAKELVETGKLQLAEVTGPMHREVANCCRYGNMALFYHGLNQTELALRHMSRALLLLSFSSGPDHPDVAATFINVAMMYQDIGKMNTALRYLQEALKKNERLLGEEHIQTAVCYHALAIAFNCMGAFKLSHQHEKKTYDILVKQLGEDDSRTRDSQNWMNTFKMRELQMNAQKQKGQALNAASAQKAIDILKAHPDLIHAFQAAAVAGGSGSSGASANKSLNAAVMGEALPRGRGIDERAARAAAEVRRKAAARGLMIRPHGVPVQALPPLTQLLNIINPGVTSDAVDNGNADRVKKEANDIPPSDLIDTKKGQTTPVQQQEQAPVGLGKGLSSLDAKKQKSKPKTGA